MGKSKSNCNETAAKKIHEKIIKVVFGNLQHNEIPLNLTKKY